MSLKDLPFEIILLISDYLPLYFTVRYLLKSCFSSYNLNVKEEQYITKIIKQRMINEGYLHQLTIILMNLLKTNFLCEVENNEIIKLFIKKHYDPKTINFFLNDCNFNFKQLLQMIEFIIENNYLVNKSKNNKSNYLEFYWNYRSDVNNICKRTINCILNNNLKLKDKKPYKIHGTIQYFQNQKKLIECLQCNEIKENKANKTVIKEEDKKFNYTEIFDENEIDLLLDDSDWTVEYFKYEIIKQKYITFKENDFIKVTGSNFNHFLKYYNGFEHLYYYLQFTKFAEIIFHPLNKQNYRITTTISYFKIIQLYLFPNIVATSHKCLLLILIYYGYFLTWKYSRNFYFNNTMGLEYLFYDIGTLLSPFFGGVPFILFFVKLFRGYRNDSQFSFLYSNIALFESINNLFFIFDIYKIYNELCNNFYYDLWSYIKKGKRIFGNLFLKNKEKK
ncbi:hypothetical protein ABK040_007386 [Willaertia magna]